MSATQMLAEATASYAEHYRDHLVSQRDADTAYRTMMDSIKFRATSSENTYGLLVWAHPSLTGEVARILDVVERMSGHIRQTQRTTYAVEFAWE